MPRLSLVIPVHNRQRIPAGTPDSGDLAGVSKLGWVDALRGIAILGVIITHMLLPIPHRMAMVTSQGGYGVQLFFVASAFTLAKSHDERRADENPIRNFFIRRFFRIAPLYYAVIPAYLLISFCDGVAPGYYIAKTWQSVVANLFFIHGWFPGLGSGNWSVPGGWSIGTEMGFYALFPFLVFFSASRLRAILCIVGALLLSILAVRIGYVLYGATPDMLSRNGFFYFWLPSQLPVFGFGFLLYAMLLAPREETGKRNSGLWLLLSVVLVSCLVWFSWHGSGLSIFGGLALAGGASFSLGMALALHPWRLLVNPVTTFLGKHSFSLYIVHFPAVWWICAFARKMTQPASDAGQIALFGATLLAVVLASVAVAILTHRLIEKPGIALGKRLIARLEARAAR